jgi:hypothetical protein
MNIYTYIYIHIGLYQKGGMREITHYIYSKISYIYLCIYIYTNMNVIDVNTYIFFSFSRTFSEGQDGEDHPLHILRNLNAACEFMSMAINRYLYINKYVSIHICTYMYINTACSYIHLKYIHVYTYIKKSECCL